MPFWRPSNDHPYCPALPAPSAATKPDQIFKVELDDRALLFPDGKPLAHVLITADSAGSIHLDGVFAFNKTRREPRFASLSLDQAQDFARELTQAVYAARTSFVLHETLKITISVLVNGYQIEFLVADDKVEFFIGTTSIWRFVKGLLMAIDHASPISTN